MSRNRIRPRVRDEIYDLLNRYVWHMDTGDIDGVIGCFTADGEVRDVNGKRWGKEDGGASGFANHYINRPNRAGGQHWIQPMLMDELDDGYLVRTYWHSLKWEMNPDRRFVRTLGLYTDTVVKVKGEWRIKDRVIDPWNSDTAPMVLDVREAIWTPQADNVTPISPLVGGGDGPSSGDGHSG
jgi:hypothetical protein